MMDSFIYDKESQYCEKFKVTTKYGKHEMYCIEDTMYSRMPLFQAEQIASLLNSYVTSYLEQCLENDRLTAILEDLNIDEYYYWDRKPKNDSEHTTNVPVYLKIDEDIQIAIMEMVCTLKNLNGKYTFCKSRLRKIYRAILEDITNGGIEVRNDDYGVEFKTKITFSEEWEHCNVPKSWEKNPLHVVD